VEQIVNSTVWLWSPDMNLKSQLELRANGQPWTV